MNRRAASLALAISLVVPGIPAPVAAQSRDGQSVAQAATPAVTSIPFASNLREPVAPGVVHRHGSWTTTQGLQAVDLIDVTPSTSGIRLEAGTPASGVSTLRTVVAQASGMTQDGHRVVAAVNGDTWNTDAVTGRTSPTGMLISHGELLSGSRWARPTVGFDGVGGSTFGDVAVTTTVTLSDGLTALTVDKVNKLRQSGELDLYTSRWGATTGTNANGTEVILTGAALPLTASGSWTATIADVRPFVGNSVIAPGSLVLSAQGADTAVLNTLVIGDFVTITTSVPPGWESIGEAVSGREWLVRGGMASVSPVSPLTTATHPRTAVGARADGSVVLATVDGRQSGESYGVTANDLASMLVGEGAVTAINLDGGGSTTAVVRLPGDLGVSVVNSPSDGSARAVDDSLTVVSTIPTGPLSQLVLRPGDRTLIAGQSVSYTARGADAALNAVPLPPAPVSWNFSGVGASVNASGVLAAQAAGSGIVTASVGGVTGSASVAVLADTMAPTAVTPVARLGTGSPVSATGEAVSVSWPASSDIGTGLDRYELRKRVGAETWTPIALATPLARSFAQYITPGQAFEYQVRAVDKAGNASAWRSAGASEIHQTSEKSASYSRGWSPRAGSPYLGAAARASQTNGSTVSYRFTGSQIAWIATRGPRQGSARVYIDGVSVAAIGLWSATTQFRRVAYTRAFSGVGPHTITIRVSGTAGHPWVDVDAFVTVTAASS